MAYPEWCDGDSQRGDDMATKVVWHAENAVMIIIIVTKYKTNIIIIDNSYKVPPELNSLHCTNNL